MLPDPILQFNLFGSEVSIYMYGVCIAVGIIVCLFVFYFYTKKKNMHPDVQDFVFFVAIFAIALGFLIAKLYQAIYDLIETGKFDFYHAGITAMGGFIGGAAAFIAAYFGVGHFLFRGKKKGLHLKEFNEIVRVVPCCITVAHAFGRIGCLMAGCCHGAYLGKEYVFGGIWMKCDGTWGYHVPTQLYEALFLFALFAVLSVLYFKNYNFTMQLYLISYGVWRIIIEIFRTDERGAVLLGLAPSQWQSIVFILGGIALFVIYKLKKIPFKVKREKAPPARETPSVQGGE